MYCVLKDQPYVTNNMKLYDRINFNLFIYIYILLICSTGAQLPVKVEVIYSYIHLPLNFLCHEVTFLPNPKEELPFSDLLFAWLIDQYWPTFHRSRPLLWKQYPIVTSCTFQFKSGKETEHQSWIHVLTRIKCSSQTQF